MLLSHYKLYAIFYSVIFQCYWQERQTLSTVIHILWYNTHMFILYTYCDSIQVLWCNQKIIVFIYCNQKIVVFIYCWHKVNLLNFHILPQIVVCVFIFNEETGSVTIIIFFIKKRQFNVWNASWFVSFQNSCSGLV